MCYNICVNKNYNMKEEKKMKKKIITVERTDIELISTIESMGTWFDERFIANEHNSFDIWEWNGKLYKIYKDSEKIDSQLWRI